MGVIDALDALPDQGSVCFVTSACGDIGEPFRIRRSATSPAARVYGIGHLHGVVPESRARPRSRGRRRSWPRSRSWPRGGERLRASLAKLFATTVTVLQIGWAVHVSWASDYALFFRSTREFVARIRALRGRAVWYPSSDELFRYNVITSPVTSDASR